MRYAVIHYHQIEQSLHCHMKFFFGKNCHSKTSITYRFLLMIRCKQTHNSKDVQKEGFPMLVWHFTLEQSLSSHPQHIIHLCHKKITYNLLMFIHHAHDGHTLKNQRVCCTEDSQTLTKSSKRLGL